jgi:hypothetical protein
MLASWVWLGLGSRPIRGTLVPLSSSLPIHTGTSTEILSGPPSIRLSIGIKMLHSRPWVGEKGAAFFGRFQDTIQQSLIRWWLG